MKKWYAEIYKENMHGAGSYGKLHLPAEDYEIDDALQKARIFGTDNAYSVAIYDCEINGLETLLDPECNIYELNFLAKRLAELDDFQLSGYKGLLKMNACNQDTIPLKELINYTYNLDDVMFAAVDNDAELARFYIDNEFLDEYSEISADIYEKLDFSRIGEEIRRNEKGVYIQEGYVVNNGKIKEIYNGDYLKSPDSSFVFMFEIAGHGNKEEPNNKNTVTLKLPDTEEHIKEILGIIDMDSIYDCGFSGFKTIVPQLDNVFENMDEFPNLNELAHQIEKLKNQEKLTTYKAILTGIDDITLEKALALSYQTEQFELLTEGNGRAGYVKYKLEDMDIPLKEQFFKIKGLHEYGQALMQKDKVLETDYGLLVSKNQMEISEYLEQTDQGLKMEM